MSYMMYAPTRVLFEAGQLNHLHEQALPGNKALLVITNGKSVRENGALNRTLMELAHAGVQAVLFDKVQANPLKSIVMAGAKAARENGYDFIVALDGGSGKGQTPPNAPLPVLCITVAFGARVIGIETARMIVDEWLNAKFEGGRHQTRIDRLAEIETTQGLRAVGVDGQ